MLVHSSGMIFVSSRDKWTLNLLWRVLPEELSQIVETQQFGKGPWNWTGMEKKADNHAVDSSGEGYLIHEMSLENCPGWRSVSLYSVREISGRFVDPLVGKTGYIALILCVLVGGAVVVLYVTAQHDIRNRRQAEETLGESEERYRSLFETTIDGVFITGVDGTPIDANQSCLDMFGYQRQEILGTSVLKCYANPEDRNRVTHDLDQRGAVKDYPLNLVKKDGTKIDCLLTGTVRKASDGKILGYRGIIRDVTEHKRTEEALRISEDKFSKAFFLSPDAIAITQLDNGMYVSVNEGFMQVLGYAEEELIGKTSLELNVWDIPEDRNRVSRG